MGSKNQQTPENNTERKIDLREGTAEFELFMATVELDSAKDLAHGARHLANLLSYDPVNKEWLEMADRYIELAGSDPEKILLPAEEKRYVSTEALRAWIRHHDGKLTEAIELLLEVNSASPGSGYLENWCADWLTPPGTIESLPEDTIIRLFATILNKFGEAHLASYRELEQIRRWAGFLSRFSYQSPHWTMIRIGLYRKSGYLDKALELAGPIEASTNWHHAVAIGLILRRQNRLEDAEKAFVKALEFDPEDISARLEAADTWFEKDHWNPALKWYENILEKEEEHIWALPSFWYCKWKLTEDETWIAKVIGLAKNGNDRAYSLWFLAYGSLPEPQDATANVLRQVIEKQSGDEPLKGEISVTVSSLEAPSNELAFRLEMERMKSDVTLKVTVSDIPMPDPREIKETIEWPLWNYDGTNPSPALPSPSAEIIKDIETLAAKPYDPHINWAAASHIAAKWGPNHCAEILAVAIYPPSIPAHTHALAWIPRVQFTVAQVVAQIDSGWDDSVRRKALLSMLFGPTDWTTAAAIRTLCMLAEKEKAYQLPIHESFLQLEKSIPEGGYCCWAAPLYDQWSRMSILFDNERDELKDKLQRLEQ